PGFEFVNVECGTAEVAALERVAEGVLIDDRTACRVDQEGAGLHLGQRFGIDQMTGLGVEGGVNRYDIALRQDFIERISVAHSGYMHPERLCAYRDRCADAAHSDDAEPFFLKR